MWLFMGHSSIQDIFYIIYYRWSVCHVVILTARLAHKPKWTMQFIAFMFVHTSMKFSHWIHFLRFKCAYAYLETWIPNFQFFNFQFTIAMEHESIGYDTFFGNNRCDSDEVLKCWCTWENPLHKSLLDNRNESSLDGDCYCRFRCSRILALKINAFFSLYVCPCTDIWHSLWKLSSKTNTPNVHHNQTKLEAGILFGFADGITKLKSKRWNVCACLSGTKSLSRTTWDYNWLCVLTNSAKSGVFVYLFLNFIFFVSNSPWSNCLCLSFSTCSPFD